MNIKSQFPIYKKYPNLVYLDSGATTLKPEIVIQKMMEYYGEYSANIHRGVYGISDKASEEYEAVRDICKKFINAYDSSEIVFTSGTTDSINLVSHGWGETNLKAGDEVVITEMEHHANLVPWQRLCQKTGAVLRYIPICHPEFLPVQKAGISGSKMLKQVQHDNPQVQHDNPQVQHDSDFLLDLSNLSTLITSKTKIVALTAVSNILGTINDIETITKIIKKINPKTLVLVDGAQIVAHEMVDVQKWGIDFLAFSGHKIYGPTGVGVLWGKKELLALLEPVRYGGGMIREVGWQTTEFRDSPDRFEGGTPPIGEVIGMGAALDWIEKIGRKKIIEDEKEITKYGLERLNKIKGLTIYGPQNPEHRSGVFSMTINGVHPHDVAEVLNRFNVCVRSGHHCAMPLHQKLGIEASFRASLGVYNTKEDIDKIVEALGEVKKIFSQ